LGRKRAKDESEEELRIPGEGEVLGVVTRLLGYDRVLVKCADGHERLCRIPGKFKKRVWIAIGDIVLVGPWPFQSDRKGDILHRYTKDEIKKLKERGLLTISPEEF